MIQLKRLIYSPIDGINKAAFIISFFTLASKLSGLVRDRILLGAFGVGDKLDAYNAAFSIPDALYNLLIVGAFSASLVPIFSGYLHKKDQEGFLRIINNILNIFVAAIIVISVLMFFLAPYVLKYIVIGWSGEKFAMTVALTRIMLLSPIFLTLSSVASGILQSTKHFFIYAASFIFYNIGIIIGALFFARFWGIYGIAAGVILGAALQFLIQWPVIKSLGYRYRFFFNYRDPDMSKIFKTMLPRTLSLGVSQVNNFIMIAVASTLANGSLVVFRLASNIQGIFTGLIGISFAVAVFSTMAFHFSAGDKKKFTESFSETWRDIALFIIPSTAYLIIFKAEIVRLIYGFGRFDPLSASLTENALVFLALGLIVQSLTSLIVRTFWVLEDTKTPFYTSLFGMAIIIVSAFWFGGHFGVVGLAIAATLADIIEFATLYFFLRRKPVDWDESNIFKSSFRIVAVTGIVSAVIWFLTSLFPLDKNMASTVMVFLRLVIGSSLALGLFLLLSKALGVEETFVFVRAFKRRFLGGIKPDTGERV